MIRVTVELISAVDPSRNRVLGVAEICNEVKRTRETQGMLGDYLVRMDEAEGPLSPQLGLGEEAEADSFAVRLSKWAPRERETWKRGRVVGFNRRVRGAWDLLYLALRELVGDRNPPSG